MATVAIQPNMETMTIEFPKVDMKRLIGIAKAMGWILHKEENTSSSNAEGCFEELSDEECWQYLCAERPEGFELLNQEEEQEFESWLGIRR